jgi:hypothetical protein
MSALLVGDRASIVVLGLSPWVIPLIAVAAKLTYEQTRNACRGETPRNRSGEKGDARTEDRPRGHEARQGGVKASLAGK